MLKPMHPTDLAAHLAVELPHSNAPIDFWAHYYETNFTRRNGYRAVWTEIASAEIIIITAMEGGSVTSIDITPGTTGDIDRTKLADEIQDFLEDNGLKENVWVEMTDKAIIFTKDGFIEKIFSTTNLGIEIINHEDDPTYYDRKMERCQEKADGEYVEIY